HTLIASEEELQTGNRSTQRFSHLDRTIPVPVILRDYINKKVAVNSSSCNHVGGRTSRASRALKHVGGGLATRGPTSPDTDDTAFWASCHIRQSLVSESSITRVGICTLRLVAVEYN